MGFCTSCGAPLQDGAGFCTKCGKKIGPQSAGSGPQPASPGGSWTVGKTGSTAGGFAGGAAGGFAGGAMGGPTGRPGGAVSGGPVSGGAAGGASGKNNGNDPNKKKSPLVPFLIAFGSALVVLGLVVLLLFLFKVWPFDGNGSDNKPAKQTTEANEPTDRTRRAADETTTAEAPTRRTEPVQSETPPPETDPTEPYSSETLPPETDPPETEPYFNRTFYGVWYGNQGTVFTLFENGSVIYEDGGTDKNKLTGTWTLDENGRFEMDLFGNGNRFYLYAYLRNGSDSQAMYDMAMNWDKSTVTVWYYETFYRTRPDRIVEGDDRHPQKYPYMP